MSKQAVRPTRTQAVIPTLRCRDARATIDFLVEAFGATRHLVVAGDGDRAVVHAQIELAPGAQIMLGSSGGEVPELDRSAGNASVYVIVDDEELSARFERARKAGARVLRELRREEYGGSGFSVADSEGNIWSFGSYDPYAPEIAE
jgi:uncharacterized glyoxalase superfamily protein PhnB